jgi:lysophospholipase L1-like esterase
MTRGALVARIALASASAVLGLALGELGLRLADLPRSGPFLQEFRGEAFKLMAYDSNPSGAFDLDLSDAELRGRLAERLENPAEFEAHWAATPWAVSFELNSQGFRERKLAAKPPGTKRVAIVGDSFTVGHGLPNALAYPRLLESRLQRAFDHDRGTGSASAIPTAVEVLNLGRGNTDLPAILRSADFALRHLSPDVLVYGYFMNDPVPSLARAPGSPIHDMLDAGWVSVDQSPSMTRIGESERGAFRVGDLMRRFFADRSVTTSTIAWYQALHAPEAWRPTLARIAATSRAARARGARFVLLLLPLPFEIADSPFAQAHRQMREAAEQAGIEVVDALPALARHPDDALRLHPRDRHPSPLYTRVVAELLAPVVLDALASGAAPPDAAPDASSGVAPKAVPEPGRKRSGK